ncbi:hypothetical protein T08_6205, partial [Trichinella sp. T8]
LPCAYLNTQGSGQSETPLIRIDDRKFSDIIMRYSLKMPRLVQYFVVLGKSIFLHFRSISNKLKKVVSIWLTCAYLNTQGSGQSETPLILIDDKKFFDIIMRYSLKMPRLVQYFVVLGKWIFFHFRSISNKLKKVVSIWVEMFLYYKNEPQAQMLLESETFPGILESSTASKRVHLPCAYLNTRGSSPSETPLISIDDS